MNGTQSLITEAAFSSNQLFTYYYVNNIIILPCPVLFVKDEASSSCVCDPLLQHYNLVCNISDVTVVNTGSIWIGVTPQGVPAYHDPCPFDYCAQEKTISVLDLDEQCSYNRSKVLCGQCKGNLSMTFGTSQCKQCSNDYLSLIIVFAIMGIVLVLVLFLFNLTISNGAMNGVVLYSNLIRINDTIFFHNRTGYSYFLSTLVAWINLDFGIEVCFYDGMDSYAKTWLQFVFPIYMFSLVGAIIIAGRYSSRISALCRFNVVPVLATLTFLLYFNVLRTIITIFSPISIDMLTTNILVWQYDGNIEYLGSKHIPLFIFGLIVTTVFIIPYSTVLLLAPCLQSWSHCSHLHWINKLKPFLDSYQAPFKDRYRFWAGVHLCLRLPLYLLFIISAITPQKMLGIIVCVLVYLCAMVGLSVYKNWIVLLIEMIFIINISIISATIIATSNG